MPITVYSARVPDNSGWRRHGFLTKVETTVAGQFGNDDRNITVTLSDEDLDKPDLHCELHVDESLIGKLKFSPIGTEPMDIVDAIAGRLANLN